MQWIRRHLNYANVMATIAVFFALGGFAVGANGGGGPELKLSSVHKDFKVPPGQTSKERVECESDRVPVSGGHTILYQGRIPNVAVENFLPWPGPKKVDGPVLGWHAAADNRTNKEEEARIWAVCAEIE
jgi:hypothetical protein